jgi:hypothetical protein|nr:hypothetical protein [uncultured Pedobacter sp.]
MKDFDSLVGIWNEQKTAPKLDYKEIITQYKTSRNKLSLKLVREVLVMLFVLIAITYVGLTSEFDFWTSYTGLVLIVLCCTYFVLMQLINIKSIADSNTLFDQPKDHIQFLKNFRKSRHIQHTRNYKIYTFFLSLGLVLYFIEPFYKLNFILTITVFSATVIWFILSYFYFLKRYIKKEDEKFHQMIEDLERLDQQFKDME